MFSEIKIYPENNADVLGIDIYKQSLERSFFYLKKYSSFITKPHAKTMIKYLRKTEFW